MPGIALEKAAQAAIDRPMAKDTIELRSLSLLSCQGETERLARYLCAGERERSERFHFQADYERYIAARAALRLQLGAFLGCDPKSLSFQYTSYEKPFLERCDVEFNLSHSGDWVLFAFTRSGEIGVDIEKIRPIPDMREVARVNFAASEFALWEATHDADRVAAFYRCWTRKESFIKAIGEGLSCPLDSFEVSFGVHQPARLMSVEGDESLANHWWMADLPGFSGYAAAVTARCENSGDAYLVMSELTKADLLE
ncbi:MAG TPA: 4'-phosphopantetheinyl transferase superfamily protein [Candidatus Binatia bacterium]|nr:4'-phosphopantetheinyl transferase superfamily protein [Candidatus Binatia bacterium]